MAKSFKQRSLEAGLGLELMALAHSVRKSKLSEAVELLKPLISESTYKYWKRQYNNLLPKYDKCGVCGYQKQQHNACWNCRINSPG
jgi:hypothetical protein